jgi:tetratricopeptide (TPR) repeat protein
VKKGLFIIVAIIMVAGGIYGAYHFSGLHSAETQINKAILHITGGKYPEAIAILKEVLSKNDYKVVRAPALYLLADTYERSGKYRSAGESYRLILSDASLKEIDNWWLSSIIALSKLYRKGMLQASVSQKQALVQSIDGIIVEEQSSEEVKEGRNFSETLRYYIGLIIAFNFDIKVETPSDEIVMKELKTELGYLLIALNEDDRAEEVLSRIDSPVSRLGLAKLYLKKGENEKGIEMLRNLLVYDKTGAIKQYYIKELYDYAESLYSKRKYCDALNLYEEVVEQAPDTEYSELSLYRLATHYYSTRNNGKALPQIEKLLSNSIPSKDEEAMLMKGYIYYDRREFVKALKVFKEFIKNYPNSKLYRTAREWKAMTERSIKYLG